MESVGVKQVLGCHLCLHDICVGKDAYNCLVIEWWGCSSLDINYGRSRLIWRWCRVFAMHVRRRGFDPPPGQILFILIFDPSLLHLVASVAFKRT